MQDKIPEEKSLVAAEHSRAVVAVGKEKKCGYWARVARAYTFAFWAILITLPLFAIIFTAIFSHAFGRENIFGFGMDLRSLSSFVPEKYQTVSYTYKAGESTVCGFRDGVAVANAGGIEVYSPDGERLLDVSLTFSAPRLAVSRQYLLAYDFGKTAFTVTNGYAVLHSGDTENRPILGAAMADTGHFALITTVGVMLYDSNFHLIEEFGRSTATTSVSISANGKHIAIAGIGNESGLAYSEVTLYRIGNYRPTYDVRVPGQVLQISFTDESYLAVLSDSSIYFLNADGAIKREYDLGSDTPVEWQVNHGGCLLLASQDTVGAVYRVLWLNESGNVRYDGLLQANIRDVSLAQDHAFFLKDGGVLRLNVKDGTVLERSCPDAARGIFAMDENAFRVVCDGEAVYMKFD